jgi:hypothetical protein
VADLEQNIRLQISAAILIETGATFIRLKRSINNRAKLLGWSFIMSKIASEKQQKHLAYARAVKAQKRAMQIAAMLAELKVTMK